MTDIITNLPGDPIENKIHTIRGARVMIDADLAELYGVTTKALNQAVKRNPERFPQTFMFQLSKEESESLRSQIVTLKKDAPGESLRGKHLKYMPYAFTEHGVLMLANVLKSHRAVAVSVQIIEVFVKLRKMVVEIPDLAKRLEQIEAKLAGHETEISAFRDIIFPLLTANIPPTRRKAGFKPGGAE